MLSRLFEVAIEICLSGLVIVYLRTIKRFLFLVGMQVILTLLQRTWCCHASFCMTARLCAVNSSKRCSFQLVHWSFAGSVKSQLFWNDVHFLSFRLLLSGCKVLVCMLYCLLRNCHMQRSTYLDSSFLYMEYHNHIHSTLKLIGIITKFRTHSEVDQVYWGQLSITQFSLT